MRVRALPSLPSRTAHCLFPLPEGISGDNDGDNREENNEGSFNEDTGIAYVKWNVVGHDNVPNGYMTDLRLAEKPYIPGMFGNCSVTRASKSAIHST